jgi:phosphoglycolate phosphatase-like HAD superfamily hydrolase
MMLFLDFDGVICDSVVECMVSSWIAYYSCYKKETPAHIPLSVKNDFFELRPFIRSGEDYLLIHQLIDEGYTVSNQTDFDFHLKRVGNEKLALYKELIYKVRHELLLNDKDYWLSLNPIYSHMLEPLKKLAHNRYVHIISTKMPKPIIEILRANKIDFPLERIHYAGNKVKSEMIMQLLAEYEQERAVFVDDQINHLIQVQLKNVDLYLATWGYIKKEWLYQSTLVKNLNPAEMVSLAARYY